MCGMASRRVCSRNHDSGTASSSANSAALAIPFDLIKRGGWVFENHRTLDGTAVWNCVQL
jgi:hypothetical protein